MPADAPSWMREATRDGSSSWTREEPPVDTARSPASAAATMKSRRVREINKRLRTIHEDDGVTYGEDVEVGILMVHFEEAVAIRRRQLKDVLAEIKRSRNVQLCFLMDATGSMGPHITGTKEAIYKIIEKLTTGRHRAVENLQLAMVAYRDHGDKDRFEILKFTKNVEDFKKFCGALKATGGADGPEDVFGGIDKSLRLGWSAEAGTKVIFHMADAPCHGTEFHDMRDDYPKGDPHNLTHTALFKEIRERNIVYHFGKINNSTDKMIAKFSEAYGEPIEDFNVKDVKDIPDSVIASVEHSVGAAISRSVTVGRRRKERHFNIVTAEPNWITCKSQEGVFITYEMPRSIQSIIDDEPLIRKRPTHGVVKIADSPFARGAERVAFYGQDVSEGHAAPIVLKEYLHVGANTAERHEMHNQMQTIAEFLTYEFMEKIRGTTGASVNISFQKIKTLSVPTGRDLRFLSCELRFKKEDKFLRFSNNTDYSLLEENAQKMGVDLDFVRLLMTFSHWTYQVSNKYLMVVDLEGIISKSSGKTTVILTDPAIHCTDLTRFGQTNLGMEGMKSFFRRHDCNKFCISLGLQVERV